MGKRKNNVITFSNQDVVASTNDKIPPHVWALLSQCGEAAAVRLHALLADTKKFNSLKGSEQSQLIRMAFEYSYGKPDAAIKRSINFNLTSDDADAVQAAMTRLVASADSEEYDLDLEAEASNVPAEKPEE